MINIAVMDKVPEDLKNLTSPIFTFNFYVYNTPEEVIEERANIDIYLFGIFDKVEELNRDLRIKNDRATFIYFASTETEISILQRLQPCYFIYKNISKDDFCNLINTISESIQYKSCMVDTAKGETIIKIKDINYINIEDRSASYHLTTNNIINSLKLRTSFAKAISHLLVNTNLYFLSPGLVLNLANIDGINQSFVYFKNGSRYPIPKKAEDPIKEAWLKFSLK